MRQSPEILCPESSTLIVNGPIHERKKFVANVF